MLKGMTFYFYDLETSGTNAREARIMQFAGQRTDEHLTPIGEPDNILIRLADDILPEPDAILITGITPQQTKQDGITEAEFLRYFTKEVATPNTVLLGFNSIRFDDEFMRFTHYRNFYDPYEWQWKDGRGKWDLLDVSRMTRALRPDGIKWPFAPDGKPSNRLELLTSVNKLDHADAHDALSDVQASIALAQLIKDKQPKLFDYLFNLRDKQRVAALVNSGQPFVYTSGKYSSEFEKTTVVANLAPAPGRQGALVYDLRHDPTEFAKLSIAELTEKLKWKKDREDKDRLPVKVLQFNRCPAIAPMSVLDDEAKQRLQIDTKKLQANIDKLKETGDFADKLVAAFEAATKREQTGLVVDDQTVDQQLYDGFFDDGDKTKMRVVRVADENELTDLHMDFNDQRLQALLPLYKARNYPASLTAEERTDWEDFRSRRLLDGGEQSRAARYFKRLGEIAERPGLSGEDKYLLEELQLYGQSILPFS